MKDIQVDKSCMPRVLGTRNADDLLLALSPQDESRLGLIFISCFFDVFGDTWHYDISWHRLMQRNWSGPVCNPMGAETRLFLFSRRKRVACAFCILSILSDLIVIWFVWNWCSAELRNSSAIFLSIKFAHRWSSPGALKAPLREVSQRVTCFDDLSVKLLCCSFPTIIVSVFCWFGTGSRWEDRGFSLLLQFLRVGRPFAA